MPCLYSSSSIVTHHRRLAPDGIIVVDRYRSASATPTTTRIARLIFLAEDVVFRSCKTTVADHSTTCQQTYPVQGLHSKKIKRDLLLARCICTRLNEIIQARLFWRSVQGRLVKLVQSPVRLTACLVNSWVGEQNPRARNVSTAIVAVRMV